MSKTRFSVETYDAGGAWLSAETYSNAGYLESRSGFVLPLGQVAELIQFLQDNFIEEKK